MADLFQNKSALLLSKLKVYFAIRVQLNTYENDHQLYLSDQKASRVNHLQGNLSKYQVTVMSKTGEGATPTEVKIDNHAILNAE